MQTIKKLWRLSEGNRMLYLLAAISICLAVLCSLMLPEIIRITIDYVLGGEELDTYAFLADIIMNIGGYDVIRERLYISAIAVMIITVFNCIFTFLKGKCLAEASENMALKLKDQLYNKLQGVAYDYHVKAQTGDLIQRCTSDVETIRKFLSGNFLEMIRIIMLAILSISIMMRLHVNLTLIALAAMPIIFLFSYFFFINVKKAFKDADEKEGVLSTVLQENLSGVRVVRAFARQDFEINKFEDKNSEHTKAVQKVIKYMAIFWSSSDFICISQIFLVMMFGVYYVTNDQITLGTFILFNTYVGMLIWPIRGLGRILNEMGRMQVSLDRVYEILDTPEEENNPNDVKHDLSGDIVFENVVFEYEENKPILDDVSFSIKSGETVAILGATGSGKSTLMHILLRLYEYKSGSVKINGKELKNIQKRHLRERIGFVLQETFLFSKTLTDNIRMAKEAATIEEITDVTKVAAVHHDIKGFEKGYETIVGEKGVTLSGGQKQRVAIARTLIKNSDILIFDDSLSAVDTETDAQIRDALNDRNENTTTIIISGRITTLMNADKIIVMEAGKVTDIGTHEQLIHGSGLYARIWNIQNMLESDFEGDK